MEEMSSEPERSKMMEDSDKMNEESNRNVKDFERNNKNNNKLIHAIGLFTIVNLLLIVLCVVTAVCAFADIHIPDNNLKLCLPCSELKHHPDDTLDGIQKNEPNGTICCVKKNEDVEVLVGYYADTWMKTNLANGDKRFQEYECDDIKRVKPVIKVVGRHDRQTESHHSRLLWNDEHDLAVQGRNISHHREHGLIEIKVTGLYQVYSQLVLEHAHHSAFDRPIIYHHSLVLIENAGQEIERTILKTSNSFCRAKTDVLSVTSTLGGTFQLSEGDRLSIKISNKSEVVLQPHMNFFGVHML